LVFLAFSLNQPNLMILDEPTNHIDLQGKQELTEQLMQSGATLIITSHDRYFLDQLVTRWLCIENQQLIEVNGPEAFYQRLLDIQSKQAENSSLPSNSETIKACDETDLLVKIEALEQKLSTDLRMKPRYQKPERQRTWQAELEQLWEQLSEIV